MKKKITFHLFRYALLCMAICSFSCTFALNETDSSSIPTKVPGKPTNVSITGSSSGYSITWSKCTGAISYKIYYSSTSTGFASQYCYTSTTNSYADTVVWPGDTWYYRISAVNVCGESEFSNIVYATIPSTYGNASQIESKAISLTVDYGKYVPEYLEAKNTMYFYTYVRGGSKYQIRWADTYSNPTLLSSNNYSPLADIYVSYAPAGSSYSTAVSGSSGSAPASIEFKAQLTGYYLIRVTGTSSYGYYAIRIDKEE